MTVHRVLIAGCGKIGFKLAEKLALEDPDQFEIWGLSRSLKSSAHPIRFIAADLHDKHQLKAVLPNQVDIVVVCLTPSERELGAYQRAYIDTQTNLLETLESSKHAHVIFVSSTSVYHQDYSSWVNETSPTHPNSDNAKILVKAERVASNLGYQGCAVRFSGIYGNGRSMLIDQVKEGKTGLWRETRLTNRVHETDCVGILKHLVLKAAKEDHLDDIYLGSDCCPVDMNEVVCHIASQLKMEPYQMNEAPRRRAGNKKCDNTKLLNSGYAFVFPSYQEGYQINPSESEECDRNSE